MRAPILLLFSMLIPLALAAGACFASELTSRIPKPAPAQNARPGDTYRFASARNSAKHTPVASPSAIDLTHAAEPLDITSGIPVVREALPDESDTTADAPELGLHDVLQLTFQANPDLRSSFQRVRIAEAALALAESDYLPTFTFNNNYEVSDNPLQKFVYLLSADELNPLNPLSAASDEDRYHLQIRLQHALYTGGRRAALALAAQFERDASRFSMAAIQNQLVYQVALAYYRLHQARDMVDVRREAVVQVDGQLADVRHRFDLQEAVHADVLEIELRLAEVREELIGSLNQFELAWAVLQNVTGATFPGWRLPAEVPAAPWSEDIERLESALALAQQTRPELAQHVSITEAAAQRVRAARAGKRPTLNLISDMDLFTTDFATGTGSYYVGLVLSLNLFDGGRTRHSLRQAQARVCELYAKNERVALDIELEVRRAHLGLKDANERLQVTRRAVDFATENLRQVKAYYESDAVTITRLRDAQVTHSKARVRYVNSKADVEIAKAALQRAVGRLSVFLSEQSNPGGRLCCGNGRICRSASSCRCPRGCRRCRH